MLRDREGRAAVVEWIKGKTVIYPHAGAVLTNSPPYAWQLAYAKKYNYVSVQNARRAYNGEYMHGSGFTGIPGDWSPPSRFARASQIIKHLPALTNNDKAINFALTVIESVQVSLGTSESPTLWKSVADLKNQQYYFSEMYHITPEYSVWGEKGSTVFSPKLNGRWQVFDLHQLDKLKHLPEGFVSARIMPALPGEVKKIVNTIKMKVPKFINQGSLGCPVE